MDSISPLAKILAEANGIDWRSIQGSGEDGSVVEQDILNYLSRIMSGDEEPPATPVDEAPAGWTGEMPPMPAAVAASGLQALSAAGVESDITDFVAQQQTSPTFTSVVAPTAAPSFQADHSQAEMAAPTPLAVTPPMLTSETDEQALEKAPEPTDADMDFELDDDTDEAPVHVPAPVEAESLHAEPVAPTQPEEVEEYAAHAPEVHDRPAYDTAPLDEEADFVLADSFPPQASLPAQTTEQPMAASHPVADAVPAPQEQGAAPTTSGFGLGGFLSRLYGNKSETAPEPVAATKPEPVQAEAAIGSAHDEHEAVPVQAAVASEVGQPAPDEFELSEPEVSEPVLGEPLIPQAPPIPDTPVAAPLVADQWRDLEDVHTEQPHGGHLDAEPAVHEAPALPEAHEGGLGGELDSSELAVGAAGLAPQQAAPAPAAHAEPRTEAAEPAPMPAAVSVAPAVLSPAFGAVTLRLNVDLGVLETARVQLSEALYREVPLTLLVARAAARSLSTLGLSTSGGVALSDHAGQPLAADLSGDFRASLSGLGEVGHSTPALLVIDAAGLGLDELHRGECSLSVGRTVGQSAALSLRGEVDPVRGAQFLHEVAGLLGTPIRLLF